jgi:hypothetical protein
MKGLPPKDTHIRYFSECTMEDPTLLSETLPYIAGDWGKSERYEEDDNASHSAASFFFLETSDGKEPPDIFQSIAHEKAETPVAMGPRPTILPQLSISSQSYDDARKYYSEDDDSLFGWKVSDTQSQEYHSIGSFIADNEESKNGGYSFTSWNEKGSVLSVDESELTSRSGISGDYDETNFNLWRALSLKNVAKGLAETYHGEIERDEQMTYDENTQDTYDSLDFLGKFSFPCTPVEEEIVFESSNDEEKIEETETVDSTAVRWKSLFTNLNCSAESVQSVKIGTESFGGEEQSMLQSTFSADLARKVDTLGPKMQDIAPEETKENSLISTMLPFSSLFAKSPDEKLDATDNQLEAISVGEDIAVFEDGDSEMRNATLSYTKSQPSGEVEDRLGPFQEQEEPKPGANQNSTPKSCDVVLCHSMLSGQITFQEQGEPEPVTNQNSTPKSCDVVLSHSMLSGQITEWTSFEENEFEKIKPDEELSPETSSSETLAKNPVKQTDHQGSNTVVIRQAKQVDQGFEAIDFKSPETLMYYCIGNIPRGDSTLVEWKNIASGALKPQEVKDTFPSLLDMADDDEREYNEYELRLLMGDPKPKGTANRAKHKVAKRMMKLKRLLSKKRVEI